jgi:hypothetical protein
VKVAYAMDEAAFFQTVKLNLELRADNLDSFSRFGSFPLSVLANIVLVGIFFGVMWYLFPSLRETVFALFGRRTSVERYSEVSQSENPPSGKNSH